MVEIEIASYTIWLQRETREYKKEKNVSVIATITAIPEDESVAGRPNKIVFVFVDSENIPESYVEGRELYSFISSKFYMNYVDLLRNEKPINVIWDREKKSCQLITGRREPVGEGPGER